MPAKLTVKTCMIIFVVGGTVYIVYVGTVGTFRSEYEIEYEYDFSNLVLMHWIVTFHSNLVPIVSFSTGQQQG